MRTYELRFQGCWIVTDDQPQAQTGSALEHMRSKLPDADPGMEMGLAERLRELKQCE